MMNIQPANSESNLSGLSGIQQKSFKFHQLLRQKHIEIYKAQVRKQFQSQSNLNQLLSAIPQELNDVLIWCKEVTQQFSNSRQYKFPDYKIIELFKLIEKFPCYQTIQLMYSVCHRITTTAIHELFQYDIVGLLQKLIVNPEKIVPRVLMIKHDSKSSQCMCIEIIKKSILVLASLCEQSQRARNFIVMNHKSFICINRVYQKLNSSVQRQFILCLYSFMCHNLKYDEQFIRIIRTICLIFYNRFSQLSFHQMTLILKSLTMIVKSKQKWAMDLIQDTIQYDILDNILKIIRQLNHTVESEFRCQSNKIQAYDQNSTNKQKLRQIGQIVHLLNIFLINYIQVSTNQYFQWQNFFNEWFKILDVDDSCFQNARRDIYFIFNNIICEAEQPQTSYQLLRSMIFQHNCIHVFSRCLDRQINQDLIQELCYCIHSLLVHKNVQVLAHDIVQSQLVRSCLDAITRNFYPANYDTKEALILGIEKLIQRTSNQQIRKIYLLEIKSYQDKLNEICLYKSHNQQIGEIVDRLLHHARDLS